MSGKRGGAYLRNLEFAIRECGPKMTIADSRLGGACRAGFARSADSFQLLDRTGQTRMFLIAEVNLVPADAVSMNASGKREPKMADRERLNQRVGSEVEFGDDVIAVFKFGAQLLDAPDDPAVSSAHASSKQKLDTALSLSFPHGALPEFSK